MNMITANLQSYFIITNKLKGNYPLSNHATIIFADNIQMITEYNAIYGAIIMRYMMLLRQYRGDEKCLDCITVEIPTNWYVGICQSSERNGILKRMCELTLLRKVNASRKCHLYYINPSIAHRMNGPQRAYYCEHHYELFNPVIEQQEQTLLPVSRMALAPI